MKIHLLVGIMAVALLFTVPTAAVLLQDDATGSVSFESTSPYATIDDGTLELDFARLNDRAVTAVDEAFTITVTHEDVDRIWISNDVDGLTFYEGSDPNAEIDEFNPLTPSADDTTDIGVAVDTRVAESGSGTETFTVHVESEDAAADDEGDEDDGPPPGITLTDLVVEPTAVETGETVTVNATYENVRQPRTELTPLLTVDETVVDTDTFEIGPGETKTVSFERQMEWPGTYEVGVDGVASESVTVEGPPVDVLEAAVVDAEITAGETATIDATVTNPTDTPVNRTVELAIGGVVVDTQQVALKPESKTAVAFEHRFDEPGTYDVAVSGVEAGTVTVSEPRSDPVTYALQDRELSATTTAALAPPAVLGFLMVVSVARRRMH